MKSKYNSYNSQAFSPEEVKAGLMNDLIQLLLSYNQESEKYYHDIHITTDGHCTIVEWETLPYSHEWGGKFVYCGENEFVAHYFYLPDNSVAVSTSEEEDEDILDEFYQDNPDYLDKRQDKAYTKKA